MRQEAVQAAAMAPAFLQTLTPWNGSLQRISSPGLRKSMKFTPGHGCGLCHMEPPDGMSQRMGMKV